MNFLKVLVIGEIATGKTSLALRIASNNFSESYHATIGCEFAFKVIQLNDDTYSVQLWDLAGQDRLGGISKLYCREAQGALVICDVTRPESIGKVAKWKAQIDETVRSADGSQIPMVLCLNKYDLVENESFTTAQLQAVTRENDFSAGFFTSAKTGYNANEALVTLVTLIIKKAAEVPPQVVMAQSGVKVGKKVSVKTRKDCC